MKIHKEGYNIIAIAFIIASAVVLGGYYLLGWGLLAKVLAVIAVLVFAFVVRFFRVPKRNTVPGDNVVTSVADGKVVIVEKVQEDEYIKGECIQVSVYMDFFNVHVNYWPVSGDVTYYKYHPGKYMLAFLPKASELNVHSSVGIRSPYGDVFFKQLAGTFARRIVTYATPGN